MDAYNTWTIAEARDKLKAREITSEEITHHAFRRLMMLTPLVLLSINAR